MRPKGKFFEGSNSLFEIQQFLVQGNIAGHALWLPHFTPVRIDHRSFVNRLLKTSCALNICCALMGTYPAYVAGVLSSHYVDSLRLSQLCIARTKSPILDNIYRKFPTFEIGPFRFHITADEEYANCPDYSVYDITHDDVTVPFLLVVVDVSVHFGSIYSINLVEFMWENACIFAFKMYAKICVPLDTPTFFYLNNHGDISGGWSPDYLCKECLDKFQPLLRPFIGNCTGTRSCRSNVYLRQAPSLRSLASYTVFHLTFNLSEFKLTRRTLYHQYVYAVKSDIVPFDRLIPLTFPKLQCTFVRDDRCDVRKRFHKACVILSGPYWSTFYEEYCDTKEEAIATLCTEKDWWCDLCNRPLFKTTDCVFF